ncbi:Uma2 family endonuclease [[Limnothrix rosea] IAM M-220]|uniref:Uma2 family endonuclease n=1 Tax=[Limnothrix rosea] IAM M-220 TaxID=454133 RepID=UPI00095B808A|nr:Uma2 family endonuclease [[Limnothrix rosea] IAM M-220]OKH18017.1 hypothetical protein NIES208_07510 [[Limnothrix rosea] IAM M-220]
MVALKDSRYLSPEEYLAWEAENSVKHEYINGEAYAMAGTTDEHNVVSGNLYLLLRNHLRGSGCSVYFADVKVRVERKNCYYYPDLFVTCNPEDKETATVKYFPKLIIEVLSPSTESFDRGDKFNDYQTIASLEEYVLVNTKHKRLEIYRRNKDNSWRFEMFDLSATNVAFKSLEMDVAIADIYEDVEIIETSPIEKENPA